MKVDALMHKVDKAGDGRMSCSNGSRRTLC